MMVKHITLKHKILMMLVLEIIALLLLFFVSQFFMERNTTLLAYIENSFVPALELGRDLEQMLTEIQRNMQDAVTTADEEVFSVVDSLHNEFLHLFEQGRTNPFFEAKKLDQLKADFQAYYALARKTSLQLIEGRSLDEELVGELDAMRERYNAIKTQLQSKTTQAKEEVSTSFSAALRNSQRSAIIMNLIILSCTFLFGGLSLLLSRSITEPLRSLVKATNRIAQGDLTQKITIRSGAELAILGTAMERMRSELYQFYQRLEQLVAERTQALQESEARFRQVISSISDHIYMGEFTEHRQWIMQYISPNVERFTGYPHEQFVTDSHFWPSLIHPDDKSVVDGQLARFLNGQISEVEYRLIRKDGESIWVRDSGRVETQAGQKNKFVYGVVSDITQRKQAEEALAKERNLLHTLINSIPDYIYVKDLESRFLLANDATVRVMGATTLTELIGKTDFDFYPAKLAQEYYEDEQAIIQSGQPLINREEPVVDQKTGARKWLLTTKVPLLDSQGNIVGFVGIGRDITEHKQAEEALRAAHNELTEKNAQLAELNANKDKFFSIISHDLRSPFTVLLGYSQLLDEELERYSRDEIKKCVEQLRASAERLHALLQNLLTWSRIQRGAMEYVPETIDIRYITSENIDLFISKASHKQITLRNAVVSETYTYADSQMVNTILRNLLSNALKFTPTGGCIDVSARQHEAHVEVAISDTGIGIKQEDFPKLFRIDTRYTNIGTAGEQGTGLGLSLCKDLIEKNRGRIWVESEVGKGTTFTFTLPKTPME